MSEIRSALVTGAGSGIGRAFAVELSERGDRLHLLDINEHAVSGLASEFGVENVVYGDVADPSVMSRLAEAIGGVDLLCLNAGVVSTSTGAPWEAPPAEWDRVLGVNLLGVVNGLRSFVPLMLERETPSQIIITASLAGATTWPGGGPYGASKHAVLAVAEQAALELAETNIVVTVLCPALVRTGMSKIGEDPGDAAAGALRAIEERRFAVVPTQWHEAVEKRASNLTSGRRPAVPTPNS
jgi:NAD(P)-dependent dehydrogenase (short-subunit alcohol dehydrogenase family)